MSITTTEQLKRLSKEQLGWLAVERKLLGVSAILRPLSMRWDGSRWVGTFRCPDFTKAQLVRLLAGVPLGDVLATK